MVLQWLREYPKLKVLADLYSVSTAQVSREINHIIPLLFCHLDVITWPKNWNSIMVDHRYISGAIDATVHLRTRVHPRSTDWYRGDKHAYFMLAQVVSTLDGSIVHVCFSMGHNNDQRLFLLSGK